MSDKPSAQANAPTSVPAGPEWITCPDCTAVHGALCEVALAASAKNLNDDIRANQDHYSRTGEFPPPPPSAPQRGEQTAALIDVMREGEMQTLQAEVATLKAKNADLQKMLDGLAQDRSDEYDAIYSNQEAENARLRARLEAVEKAQEREPFDQGLTSESFERMIAKLEATPQKRWDESAKMHLSVRAMLSVCHELGQQPYRHRDAPCTDSCVDRVCADVLKALALANPEATR